MAPPRPTTSSTPCRSWAESHEIVANDDATAELLDLPTAQQQPASPALLLAALRKIGVTSGELVLPVAGDLRGLRGHAPFAAAALQASEAAVLSTWDGTSGDNGDFGLVPEWRGPAGCEVGARRPCTALDRVPPAHRAHRARR